MNSKEIFSLTLNIEKLWYIKDIILEKPNANIVLDKFHVKKKKIKLELTEKYVGNKFT